MNKSEINFNSLESIIKVEPEEFQTNELDFRHFTDHTLKSRANM